MPPKKKKKLPKALIHMKNADKAFHERWTQARDELNFPHPARIIICGKPNSGKTSIIKNLIVRADPEFESITVLHCDEETQEYEDIGAQIITEVPPLDEFDRETKNLLIIDDLSFKNLDKEAQKRLDRLFGYSSTHRNITIMLTSQVFHSIPINIRRCSNVFILWKSNDFRETHEIACKIGMDKDTLVKHFGDLQGRDSIWIDGTDGSPYPLRKNGYEKLG
jgi:hypothetical protein